MFASDGANSMAVATIFDGFCVSEKTNWKVAGPNGAAALLGMHRTTLQSRMQKLGIRVSRTAN